MILNSIILDNIRSYEHEEIEFPRGISLFEGDIGSGKSTVLMAIEFALFGLGSQKPEALLSKKALLRSLGTQHERRDVAELEKELLSEINSRGQGVQGMGGVNTALAVQIEIYPCHIASLPVAINIQCHAHRHKEINL